TAHRPAPPCHAEDTPSAVADRRHSAAPSPWSHARFTVCGATFWIVAEAEEEATDFSVQRRLTRDAAIELADYHGSLAKSNSLRSLPAGRLQRMSVTISIPDDFADMLGATA